jgi:hypothetical protein
MIKVKIRNKGRNFTIPVPYTLLNIFSTILTSRTAIRIANRAIEKDGKNFKLPQLDRNDLKPLLQALSENKGIVLVEIKLMDGTEVLVKL